MSDMDILENPNRLMLWDPFLEKDYQKAAEAAAKILKESWALDAIHIAGLSLVGLGRIEEGYEWCCASLSLAASKPDWFANAAIAFLEKKEFVRAMVFAKNGAKEYPEDIRLSYMCGLCLCHGQAWEDGIKALDETLVLDPSFYHARMSKGFCFHMMGEYEKAIECYNGITREESGDDYEEVINNYGCVLLEMGKPYDALALLDKHYPDSTRPGTLYNRSFLYLGMGDWPRGWDLYRNRQIIGVEPAPDKLGNRTGTLLQRGGETRIMPHVEQVLASTLDDIKGKDLFFFHEQGLGDSLQFVRYAKLLRPHVSHITIGVPVGLFRLMKTFDLPEGFDVVCEAERDKEVYTKCEIAMPMLDAPYLMKTIVDTIPDSTPYFKIPEEEINKHTLPDMGKPKIGLVWAGSARPDHIRAHSIDKRRSMSFEQIDPILQLSDQFDFYSLQLADHHVDDPRLARPLEQTFDMLDTATIISQLDLVITIDSALAHVTGALNKPVWLLSRYDACWRWFFVDQDSPYYTTTPWYPSMMIFRQKSRGAWTQVIEDVVSKLKDWRPSTP